VQTSAKAVQVLAHRWAWWNVTLAYRRVFTASHLCADCRADVGIGNPMDLGMGRVGGDCINPHGLMGILWGLLNRCEIQ